MRVIKKLKKCPSSSAVPHIPGDFKIPDALVGKNQRMIFPDRLHGMEFRQVVSHDILQVIRQVSKGHAYIFILNRFRDCRCLARFIRFRHSRDKTASKA